MLVCPNWNPASTDSESIHLSWRSLFTDSFKGTNYKLIISHSMMFALRTTILTVNTSSDMESSSIHKMNIFQYEWTTSDGFETTGNTHMSFFPLVIFLYFEHNVYKIRSKRKNLHSLMQIYMTAHFRFLQKLQTNCNALFF